jgi:hypothetical protein
MIERVQKTNQLANYNKRVGQSQWGVSMLDKDLDQNKIPVTGYLTNESMLQWLV